MSHKTTSRKVQHTSRIELSQTAVKKNVNFIRKKIGAHPKLSAVVKANAYGHGIKLMVQMLEEAGVDHFSVASAYEAEEVVEACAPGSTVMIMGILYDQDIGWAIENDVEFYVFNHHRLPLVVEKAEAVDKPALVHIEVETGTNRTGMTEAYFKKALKLLTKNPQHLKFQGICTHLAGIEDLSNQFRIKQQMVRFRNYLKTMEQMKLRPTYRHVGCSAAALAFPETHYDLVRVGVAVYGLWPSPDIYYLHLEETGKKKDAPMSRIITWKTEVMDLKRVPEGEFIGYGTAFQAQRDMDIAVIPLGYSNGYPRGMSNRGQVLIHGRKAPILGLINMNLFMVDISHIEHVQIGDEVVLLGNQHNNAIQVSYFTDLSSLLNVEWLSRLPAAIPRTIVR